LIVYQTQKLTSAYMNTTSQEVISKLKIRRSRLAEELGQQIAHIEEITAAIQIIEGESPNPNMFPPKNPFLNIPIRRLDTETYLLATRRLISRPGEPQTIQRKPGAKTPDLIIELGQRIREVNRIISGADQEIERLEPRSRVREIAQRIQELQSDRDRLAGELQFYKDLKEALENRPARLSREELQEQRDRARNWADA
jgi:hypothetical protein